MRQHLNTFTIFQRGGWLCKLRQIYHWLIIFDVLQRFLCGSVIEATIAGNFSVQPRKFCTKYARVAPAAERLTASFPCRAGSLSVSATFCHRSRRMRVHFDGLSPAGFRPKERFLKAAIACFKIRSSTPLSGAKLGLGAGEAPSKRAKLSLKQAFKKCELRLKLKP